MVDCGDSMLMGRFRENVARKLSVQALQKQVDVLEAQLLEVRNANIKLQSQVHMLHLQASNVSLYSSVLA